MEQKFYVYEWYNTDTNEVFYVGKGCGNRYKNKKKRNNDFIDYVQNNNVNVRIIKDNLTESEAFEYEKIITDSYKNIDQCQCNLAEAGHGGCNFIWTEEMREYWSKNNPMKEKSQRERMKEHNPMKNKEIAMKNGKAHKKPIFIGEQFFEGLIDAAKLYNVNSRTIKSWLDKGISPLNEKCGYINPQTSIAKGIPVLVDNIQYNSIKEAAKIIGVSDTALNNALRKGIHEYKGHSICKLCLDKSISSQANES